MGKRDRRKDIMQAAEDLFTSRRFHEITMDDVSHKAGVGKGTIYRYFQDKDDLFSQTAMHGFDELCDLLERTAPSGTPFAKHLLGACERVSAFFRKRRPLFRMMQTEEFRMHWCKGELRSRWMTHRKRMASAVANILHRGIQEGSVRGDVPAEVLASILLSMLRTHARDLAETPGKSNDLRIVVDLFLHGAGGDAQRHGAVKQPLATMASSGDRI
jgi:AcrR family transcriptional regulator